MRISLVLAASLVAVTAFAFACAGKKKSSVPIGDFTLLPLDQPHLDLPPGAGQAIAVKVSRAGGYQGDIEVAVASAPAGITSLPLTIAAGTSNSSISIAVATTTQPGGPYHFSVSATGGGNTHAQPIDVYVTSTTFGPDITLGSAGTLVTSCSGTCHGFNDVAFTADDGIVVPEEVVVGTSYTFTLAKFDSLGAVDTSFGTGGVVTTTFPGIASAEALQVAVDTSGRILAAGESLVGTAINDTIVARYHPDGTLDTSFGTGGYALNALGSTVSNGAVSVYDLALDAAGHIYLSGEANPSGLYQGFLMRLLPSGALDTTGFSGAGKVFTANGTAIYAMDIDERFTSGPLFMVGLDNTGMTVWRYELDGSPVLAFGNAAAGYEQTFLQGFGEALVFNESGDMLLTGLYQTGSPYPLLVAGVASSTGALDNTVGGDGSASAPYDNSNVSTNEIYFDDEPVLTAWLVGQATAGDNTRSFVIARTSGATGAIDTTFGASGFYVGKVDGFDTGVIDSKRDRFGRVTLVEDVKDASNVHHAALQRFFVP